MRALSRLRSLEARGIYLMLQRGVILCQRASRLTAEERAAIRDLKPDLIEIMRPKQPFDPDSAAVGEAYVDAMRDGVALPPFTQLTKAEAAELLRSHKAPQLGLVPPTPLGEAK